MWIKLLFLKHLAPMQRPKTRRGGWHAFTREKRITVLHNGSRVSCSFGTTQSNDRGFWKTRAQISMTIQYEGWFGKKYVQAQTVEVVDSASFTGYMWGEGDA
jgi:hypothetical protein